MLDRAKQFLPFDALKGFDEALKEKEKIIINKKELLEDEQEILSFKLKQIKTGIMVKVVYFYKNEYLLLEGMVTKIDFHNFYIMIVRKKIKFEDIISISSNDINDFNY